MSFQTHTTSAAIPADLTLAAVVETLENFKREFPDPDCQGFFVSPAVADAVTRQCAYRPGSDIIPVGLRLTEFAGMKTHIRSWMPNGRVIPIPFRLTEKFEDFEARARAQVEIDK